MYYAASKIFFSSYFSVDLRFSAISLQFWTKGQLNPFDAFEYSIFDSLSVEQVWKAFMVTYGTLIASQTINIEIFVKVVFQVFFSVKEWTLSILLISGVNEPFQVVCYKSPKFRYVWTQVSLFFTHEAKLEHPEPLSSPPEAQLELLVTSLQHHSPFHNNLINYLSQFSKIEFENISKILDRIFQSSRALNTHIGHKQLQNRIFQYPIKILIIELSFSRRGHSIQMRNHDFQTLLIFEM